MNQKKRELTISAYTIRIVQVASSNEKISGILAIRLTPRIDGRRHRLLSFRVEYFSKLKTLLALAHKKNTVWLDHDFFFSVELSDHLLEGFFAHLQLCLDLFCWAVVVKR